MAFDFDVIIRNKQGIALERLKKDCSAISWTYDAMGGCMTAEITLRRDFDNYGDINHEYGVEIYEVADMHRKGFDIEIGVDVFGGAIVPGAPLPAALPFPLLGLDYLRWSGFVREPVPVLDNPELVTLRCSGWSRQLEYIAVASKEAPIGPIAYQNGDVGLIARTIIDSFVIPGTRILRTPGANLCQDTGITVSAAGLIFETSAWEALRTLADIPTLNLEFCRTGKSISCRDLTRSNKHG